MKERIDVALVGAGGYGDWYLSFLLGGENGVRLAAVVDPEPWRCTRHELLQARGVPIFASLEAFLASGARCDLAVLATPIHHHARQAVLALDHGSHVLCEKPLCASLDEVRAVEAAERRSGKTVTVGYQWSFSRAIQAFKADAAAGRFGAARRLRTLVGWPRTDAYYGRNGWAGRQRTGEGAAVFDSPVNNAAAHYLHNMLYVLGGRPEAGAAPLSVEAELWRANPIENYDTAALRIDLGGGAEGLFLASHAVEVEEGPLFSYEFERGTARLTATAGAGNLVAVTGRGERIDYGSPDAEPERKLWSAVAAARGGPAPACGVTAAAAQVRCAVLAQEAPIRDFAPGLIRTADDGGGSRRFVVGLSSALRECYRGGMLFSELPPGAFPACAGEPLQRV